MTTARPTLCVSLRTQAKLYEARRDMASAEQLYRFNLSRLDAVGLPLGSDAVEALLFIAARCKASLNFVFHFVGHYLLLITLCAMLNCAATHTHILVPAHTLYTSVHFTGHGPFS